MEYTSTHPPESAASDDRFEWLIASIKKIINLADVRDLELIYQFSKEIIKQA